MLPILTPALINAFNAKDVLLAWMAMERGIQRAGDGSFQSRLAEHWWFGRGMQKHPDTLLSHIENLQRFLRSGETLVIDYDPVARYDYANCYIGQEPKTIYLCDGLNRPEFAPYAVLHRGLTGYERYIPSLAHELSHLVLNTNDWLDEHYDEAARKLPRTSAWQALHNADNWAYFIEMCR